MASATKSRGSAGRRREKKSRLGLWTAAVLLLLVAAFLGVLEMNRPRVGGDALRLDTFIDLAEHNRVKTARVLDFDSYAVGTYVSDDGTPRQYNAVYLKDTRSGLLDILLSNHIPTTIDQQTGKRIGTLAAYLLPGMALVVLFGYLILSSRRGTGLFKVRSGARRINAEPGGVTFADVAGQDAAVAELREITSFLADPARYVSVGAQVPKGVLLYGPPGCGKTLLARALAGEAGASFYSISGSDFVELYVGVGAARVRDLFKEARLNAPAVVFIDELDSVGRARGNVGVTTSHPEQEQALNQILAEMDGFSTSDGIIVVAATNRPDILDQALLRPGRFDRSVALERPDEPARLAILSIHAKGKRLDPDVDLADIATRAVGLTGADLASVMNEGALLAARADRVSIAHVDLDQALQRVVEGPERQRRLSMRDRSIGRRASEQEKVTFADVAGQDAAVAELREIGEYLAEPDRYAALGARVPRGVLLYGPPGCGKTLMARALAGETHAAFFHVGASEFVEMYTGQGASRVRNLFSEAKQMAPAIVFIDELDSLGRSRGGVKGDRRENEGEQQQSLNQILAELDGFSERQGVIVLAATNRPDVLDPALLRPGRFDRTVGLESPNEEARLAILSLHARGKALAADVSLRGIADRSHGLTGADLANVMNEAALLAARREKATIAQAELDDALQRTLEAPERQRRLSTRARSVGKRATAEGRVTFADVAGVDDAVTELADVTQFLSNPDRFAQMGAAPPRGILLSGPPGCGKTLLARAVAGEANAAFLSASAAEFVEVFVGEGAARVRDLFAEARSMAPSIVFIDEIDAVGGHRTTGSQNTEREQTLNQILVELDGFEGRQAVIVIAATNRPDMLDAALVRPGRFDRRIELAMPDRAGRQAILALHASSKPLGDDVDLNVVAGLTQSFSGADLANVLNEAALLATRGGHAVISPDLVEQAIDRALLGISSRRHVMTLTERRSVAYHEAGHALVARSVDGGIPPYKLTIAPSGGTLGHCSLLDTHDRVVHSRSLLIARMATFLGGWAAEKLVLGETGSGAAGDLRKVNDIARRMVCEYGMSDEVGPLGSDATTDGEDARSPEVRRAIRALADEAHQTAVRILERDRVLLDGIAAALIERETLTAADIERLTSGSERPSAPARSPRPARRAPATSGRRTTPEPGEAPQLAPYLVR